MRASKNEMLSTNIDRKKFSRSFLKRPSTLDIILKFMSKLEREILVLFIVKRPKLTAKHIERIIQSAYLFNAADQVIKEELKKGHKINKLLFKDAPYFSEFVYYFYAVARYPADETYYGIEPPKDIEIPEEDTHIENLTKFFIAEEDTSAEAKRLKLITEANKVNKYRIPSNTKINAIISDLTTQGYIEYIKEKNKTLFFMNPDFFDVWLKRHEQILEELEQKKKDPALESETEKDIQNYKFLSEAEAKKSIPMLHESALEDKAKWFILKKYGPIVYEFFLLDTAYFDDKGSLLILKYSDEIATYTPY